MASGIFINIRLEVFYQRFLRGYFNNNNIVFTFPKRSAYKWNELLHWLVNYPPANLKIKDYGEENFRVELPWAEHFDIQSRNHMSERSQEIFRRQVRSFYLNTMFAFIDELVHKQKLTKKDAMDRFMEMHQMADLNDDRVKKEVQRYRQRIITDYYNRNSGFRMKKYRKKMQLVV